MQQAFIRVRDLGFLELIHSIEVGCVLLCSGHWYTVCSLPQERKRRGKDGHQVFLADIFAHQVRCHVKKIVL